MKKVITNRLIFTFLLSLYTSFAGFAQTYQDNLANDSYGDFPSNWDVVTGMATVEQQDGYKFISLKHGSIIKPIINNQTNNYLNGDFIIEFDVFFGKTSSIYGQRIPVRLWDGKYGYKHNDIRYQPFIIKRNGISTSWAQPQPGNAENFYKEFYTLEPVWRHVTIECKMGKLKIRLDDKLILNLPRFKMQPTMVSIGGGINDSSYDAKVGFANFTIVSSTNDIQIAMIVDRKTNRVLDINSVSNLQKIPNLKNVYPNTKTFLGTISGNHELRPVEFSDVKKPQFIDLNTYGNYTLLPEKNAQMIFDFEHEYITENLRFNEVQQQILKASGSTLSGNYFETKTTFNTPTKDIMLRNGQLYIQPIGIEPLTTVSTNENTGNNSHLLLSGNPSEETQSTSNNNSNLLELNPINNDPNTQSTETLKESASEHQEEFNQNSGIQQEFEFDNEEYIRQQSLKRIEFGNADNENYGYSKLEVIDITYPLKNVSNILGEPTKEKDEKNNTVCVTKTMEYNSNSNSFSEFALNAAPDWMMPGVILKARDYIKGEYNVFKNERNPIKLNITAFGDGSRSVEVSQPHDNSNILEAINTLVTGENDISMFGAPVYKEIHSKQEFSFKLMGKYSNKIAAIQAELNIDFKENYHYYLYDLTQHMFSIDLNSFDKTKIFISNKDINFNDLIYISRVNYGRKAIVVIESKYNLKEIAGSLEAKLNTLVHKAKLETDISYLNEESNFSIKALLYGGDTTAAFKSINASIAQEKIVLGEYLETESDVATNARPISYELKNMAGQPLGVTSILKQTVRTCSPSINTNTKIRVTLTDLLCINKRDRGSNPDDYGFQQSVEYLVNNKEKIAVEKDIKTFSNENCNNILPYNENLLICGDINNQLHVDETLTRFSNISNSLVFEITPDELQNPNSKFTIYSWLKEYTDDKPLVLFNGETTVNIIEVLADLLILRQQQGNQILFDKTFYDTGVYSPSETVFKDYGLAWTTLWLKKTDRNALEGPVVLGRPNLNDRHRGAAWIRFEIIN
ncbi:thiol-activated cytolysin [Tenacibaculum lutimaris]|uniref:Thiol-activated cytolysin n=1 Tax=Tenacibaculum lutimaris TaxID=285258 RepID=A0A420DYB8_9FLAO|nr:thiol-activated cytolysin family protein [Tenacibaculum lutimaris]RKF02834.1 thiol-activated cytolysin [Tenacibaculum lutimaris]